MAINLALTESAQLQTKLQEECDIYREIASFGSILFFAADEFSKRYNLYAISTSTFVKLFLKSLTSFEVPAILSYVYRFTCNKCNAILLTGHSKQAESPAESSRAKSLPIYGTRCVKGGQIDIPDAFGLQNVPKSHHFKSRYLNFPNNKNYQFCSSST